MMVISTSGVAGVAAVKSFKEKWRLVLEREKTVVGQRMSTGKTVPWTVIISLVQRCAERKWKKTYKEMCVSSVLLEAVCTAFGNYMVEHTGLKLRRHHHLVYLCLALLSFIFYVGKAEFSYF